MSEQERYYKVIEELIRKDEWNAAIKATIETIAARNCGECDFSKIYIEAIKKLIR